MDATKESRVAPGSGRLAPKQEGPYTRRAEGNGSDMTAGLEVEFRALDRKVTDGLNLLHLRLEEVRQEFRAEMQVLREEVKVLREEVKVLREEVKVLREEVKGLHGENKEIRAELADLKVVVAGLAAEIRHSNERSRGTRRLVLSVLGAVALFLGGALLRPLLEQAALSLLGG